MMFRAVAFDLGGVLVDVSLQRLYDAIGGNARRVEEAFFAEGNHDALSTGRRHPGEFVRIAAERLDIDPSVAADAWRRIVCPYPGSLRVLSELLVPAFAWSNTDPIHAEVLRRDLPPGLWSPRRCLSYEVGADKPDKRFFEEGLRRAGIAVEALLYLDDRPDNIAAARGLGIQGYCVRGVDEVRHTLEAHRLLATARQGHLPSAPP